MPQKNWDKYEVALLIEAYQNIKQGRLDRNTALVVLSQKLRQMAINEGLEIDDTFRNLNGMQWQMGFIERAFMGEDYESRTPPRIFIEMVAMFNENQMEFQTTLDEAHRKIVDKEDVSYDKVSEEAQPTAADKQELGVQILDFNNIPNLSFTKPIYASYKGIDLDAYNWKVVYISILNLLYRAYPVRLNNYIGESFGCGTRIDLSYNSADLISPKLISSEFSVYAESNLSAYDIAKHMATVLKICGISYEKLVIKYKRKESGHNEDDEVRKIETERTEAQKLPMESFVVSSVIDEYVKWLANERGLSESTSRAYGSNLKIANIKAQEMGLLNSSLFDVLDENLQKTINTILQDNVFFKFNRENHNRFSAALNAYLMFKTGESVSGIRARKHNKKQETIDCSDELKKLLLKKFPYGIRIDSEIDIIKLKNFAEMFEVTLPENEELLKAQISAGGILFEGKIYIVSDEIYNGIIQKINDVFAEGFSVIYYEELLGKNFDWFDENHISSWELLREILDRKSEDLYIAKNFLRKGMEQINEADAVEKEMESVWGYEPIHTYDEMYKRLPYIPSEKVKFYLSYCQKFVWSTHETFAWIDKVIISEKERQAIIDYVESECELKGHASIANVPLDKIEEENYQISITAIYDAVYRLMLSDRFSINGKILTKNDSAIDALTLAKSYCADKEECTFEQLNNYVISINGTGNRQITFCAAYEQMIRLDEERFVADHKVQFDIDDIDELLEQMIKGDFASIKSIATFILFPNCGYTWTHYLLESFCYRFSKKYRLDVINFNDKNAGIIAKKEVSLSYVDMLAVTALRSGLDLRTDIIGEYLYNNGYIARKRGTILNNTVERAKQMKEGR